jgi:hypothetical protein
MAENFAMCRMRQFNVGVMLRPTLQGAVKIESAAWPPSTYDGNVVMRIACAISAGQEQYEVEIKALLGFSAWIARKYARTRRGYAR